MKLKSLLLISAITLLHISGFSQISYEGTHDDGLTTVTLDNGEAKYATYQKTDKTMILYNLDHSLWKTVALPIPGSLYFDELKSVSVTVFNTDSLVELAYTCVEYLSNNDLESTTTYVDERHTLFIINEEGSMVMEEKNSNNLEIVDINGTRKLWVYKQAGQGNDTWKRVNVYALPDAPIGDIKIDQRDQSEYRAFGDRRGI